MPGSSPGMKWARAGANGHWLEIRPVRTCNSGPGISGRHRVARFRGSELAVCKNEKWPQNSSLAPIGKDTCLRESRHTPRLVFAGVIRAIRYMDQPVKIWIPRPDPGMT